MSTVKVKLLLNVEHRSRKHKAGEELEVSLLDANKLIGRGIAERVREVGRPKLEAQPAVQTAQNSFGDEK